MDKKTKILTIAVVAGALAMFLGFMGWMSYGRYLEAQNPVLEVRSDDQFNQEIMNSTEPVFIFFYSKRSSNSAKELPLIERCAKDYQGRVKFLKVSADNLPEIPLSMGIDRVPAMVVVKFKEKTLVGAIGFLDLPELQKLIDEGIKAQPPTPPTTPPATNPPGATPAVTPPATNPPAANPAVTPPATNPPTADTAVTPPVTPIK